MSEASSVVVDWRAAWPHALEIWSRFTRLREPVWCSTAEEEKREGLRDSFAMIRFDDQRVVISLRQVEALGIQGFPREVLGHEIGHHIYCPANLGDQGRMVARIRRGLPTRESCAGLIANLYADLLINNRLQRGAGLSMAGVYRALLKGPADKLWTLYMRIYERLWALPKGSLTGARDLAGSLEGDAQLGARLARVYAEDWLEGAGRFAVLCLPYLEESDRRTAEQVTRALGCSGHAGDEAIPEGLAEVDPGEEEDVIHPALDPRLNDAAGDGQSDDAEGTLAGARERMGGTTSEKRYRDPVEYREILKAIGIKLDPRAMTIKYYRELAVPHLVRFPIRSMPQAREPVLEGFERWELGAPLEDIDWLQTLVESPTVVPGLTTRQRVHGWTEGQEPEREPLDLYIGIDCSGSMLNPQIGLSYPVLAGTILTLSALRAGARVMAVLSGEPGQAVGTDGFIRDERQILGVLTSYLGTGYSFGIHRLAEVFDERDPGDRPAHILIVTDQDIFSMLGQRAAKRLGWEVAREAREKARGGATYILNMPAGWRNKETERMAADGWSVYRVAGWEEVVAFARDFSRRHYERRSESAKRMPEPAAP